MVQAFASDDRITAVNVVDCFRGMAGRGDKGLNLNPHFGIGKAWARGEAERLVEEVMIDGALAQYYSTNRAGWSNAYIKVGENVYTLLTFSARRKSPPIPPGLHQDV
jgi:bloom syndrome protein